MLENANILAELLGDFSQNSLMQLSVAFFGKITELSEECDIATIQPLNMAKATGKEAIERSIIKKVPVLYNARYRLIEIDRDCTIDGNKGCSEGSCSCTTEVRKHLKKEWIKVGDIAFCVCADRDISQTREGKMSVPKAGHHESKDAVVVGVLP